jgi:hypothetical protein
LLLLRKNGWNFRAWLHQITQVDSKLILQIDNGYEIQHFSITVFVPDNKKVHFVTKNFVHHKHFYFWVLYCSVGQWNVIVVCSDHTVQCRKMSVSHTEVSWMVCACESSRLPSRGEAKSSMPFVTWEVSV